MIKILSLIRPSIDSIFGRGATKKHEPIIKLILLCLLYFLVIKPFISVVMPIISNALKGTDKILTSATTSIDMVDYARLDSITAQLITETHADKGSFDLLLSYPLSSGFGLLSDSGDVDEDRVIMSLNTLSTKDEVIYVCRKFKESTGKSLMTQCKSFFDSSDIVRLNEIVKLNWY